jgi:hypothetical protein
MPLDVERGSECSDGKQIARAIRYIFNNTAGLVDLVRKLQLLGHPVLAKAIWIGLESQVALHNQHSLVCVADAVDFYRKGEAVQQLRAEIAFLRVHGADQDEACRVCEGNAFALDNIHPHGSRVEQQIYHVII